jgi:hypothetical protein
MRSLILSIFLFLILFSTAFGQGRALRLVVLPDTQSYLESCPEIMGSQFTWISNQGASVDYVLHVGDITQSNTPAEWALSAKYFDLINGKIPYAFSLGNHDFGSGPDKYADVRDSHLANKYFPAESLEKNSQVKGFFEQGKIDNTFHEFEFDGQKWLILALEFGPRNKVLDWSNEVVEKHPNHKIILLTHAYMYVGDKRQSEGDNWRAQAYGIGKDTGEDAVNDGEDIWQKLVKKHPNFLLAFSGHVLHEGYGRLVSEGIHGNQVYQFLSNFQRGVAGYGEGCNGFLRIVDIDLKNNSLQVKTYSPWLDQWLTDEHNEFKYILTFP